MNFTTYQNSYVTLCPVNLLNFTLTIMLYKNNQIMKKLSFYLMVMVLSLNAISTTTYAATAAPNTTKEVPAEVKIMQNRLEEIKNMDKSALKSSEKKELRKEVRTIKKSLKASGNGVYLSVGAIIIIVLLLILLL